MVLVSLIVAYFTSQTIEQSNYEEVIIDRVVDGDTVYLIDGTKVRISGVNTPEKEERCYEEAKSYLETIVESGKVYGVKLGKDRYNRELMRLLDENYRDIGLELIERGYAIPYYSEDVPNWDQYIRAQERAIENNGCVWEKSEYYDCIKIDREGYEFKITNLCDRNIEEDIKIRDTSSSHRFSYHLQLNSGESKYITEKCYEKNKINLCQKIFNSYGDELIVWDSKGKVMGYYFYGVYK